MISLVLVDFEHAGSHDYLIVAIKTSFHRIPSSSAVLSQMERLFIKFCSDLQTG